jgi:hypothetical protein
MAYFGRYPSFTLKNQKAKAKEEIQMSPYVEYGTVASIDADGVGRIASATIGDTVIFSVRGACHAIVKGDKARFESLFGKGAHAPAVGLEVAFIAGYAKNGDSTAIAEVWCSKVSWEKAVAQRDAQPKGIVTEVLPVETPVQPNTHGAKRKPRRCPKVIPFSTGEAVAMPSEQQAVS